MVHMKKKLSALFVFLLVFSTALSGNVFARDLSGAASGAIKPELPTTELEATPQYNNSDKVRVIVEVKDQATIKTATERGVLYQSLSSADQEKLEKDAVSVQNQVKTQMQSQNIHIDLANQFTTVFNGFSGTIAYGDIAKIKKLSNVKAVYIANEYKKPEPVSPDMTHSYSFIQNRTAWADAALKGEGTVVAIIDTGIDYTHRDFVLSPATQTKLSHETVNSLISQNGLKGQWYTDKVPYGYNYYDENNEVRDLGPDASMHGMHVAGIVGANGDEANGGVKGVAPETQLLALKVFSNNPAFASTYSDIYLKAIDDAIKLGADAINMSLGASAGFYDPLDPVNQAITNATDNGVVVSVSSGNSGTYSYGYSHDAEGKEPFYPLSSNPDIGVVGDPSVSRDTISVAASGNYANYYQHEITVNGAVYGTGYGTDSWDELVGLGRHLELVSLGAKLGYPEDYTGLDVRGKVVLVKRGTLSFSVKAQNAAKAGAVGIIVADHGLSKFYEDQGKFAIPIMLVMKPVGDALLATASTQDHLDLSYRITSSSELNDVGKITDFSSWGTTPTLEIKPEITAPGGNIYSTVNDNHYEYMSGTSMAAPHVAGGSVLVKQYVKQHPLYSTWSAEAQARLVKTLLMNTADIILDSSGHEYSPRAQGAGMMQVYNAVITPVRVVNKADEQAKVELKDFTDQRVQFTLSATNDSDHSVTYNVYVDANTDKKIIDKYGYEVNPLTSVPINGVSTTLPNDGQITIDPGQTVDIPVIIDLTQAEIDINSFVEGFVRLEDVAQAEPKLSIPFVGFYGDWETGPSILDGFAYIDPLEQQYYGIAQFVDNNGDTLGGEGLANAAGETVLPISPNNDKVYDSVEPIITLLRNAKEVQFNILDANLHVIRTLKTETDMRKNYFNNKQGTFYTYTGDRYWDGTVNGKVVNDGIYYYEIKTTIDPTNPNAWQTKRVALISDTTAPAVAASYDNGSNKITFSATDTNGTGVQQFVIVLNGKVQKKLPATSSQYVLTQAPASGSVIQVLAVDIAGNIGQETIGNTGTSVAPLITNPKPLTIFDNSKVDFAGYFAPDVTISDLKINGQKVDFKLNPVQNRYEFTTTVTLPDGIYSVPVEYKDKDGKLVQYRHGPIFIDTTSPVIDEIPTFIEVDKNAATADLSFKVKDNFDEIRVYLDGNEIFYHAGLQSYAAPVAFDKKITYNVKLPNETNSFVLKATDLTGHVTTKTVVVSKVPGTVPPTPSPNPNPNPDPGTTGTTPGTTSPAAPVTPDDKGTTTDAGTLTKDGKTAVLAVSGELLGKQLGDPAAKQVAVTLTDDQLKDVDQLTVTLGKEDADKLAKAAKDFVIHASGFDIVVPAAAVSQFIGDKGFAVTLKLTAAGTVGSATSASGAIAIDNGGKPLAHPVSIVLKADKSTVKDARKLSVYKKTANGQWTPAGIPAARDGLQLTVLTDGSQTYALVEQNVTFSDIAGHWAKDDIEVLASLGIVNGDGGLFKPAGTLTRAEFAAELVRALGLTSGSASGSFSDVPADAWYADAVNAAAAAGIVQGADGAFNPNAPITREQIASMITRAFKIDVSAAAAPSFSDADSIAAYAKDAVGWAQANGIINGTQDGNFNPKASTKRAEAAALLYRLLEVLKR